MSKSKPSQLELLTEDVTIKELRARGNKAEFEAMDYYIKAFDIQAKFLDTLEKVEQEKIAERIKLNEAMTQQIKDQVDQQNESGVNTVVEDKAVFPVIS